MSQRPHSTRHFAQGDTSGYTDAEIDALNAVLTSILHDAHGIDPGSIDDAIHNAVGETFDAAAIEAGARRVLGLRGETKTARLHIRATPSFYAEIKQAAADTGMTVTEWVEHALRAAL